MKTLKNGQRVTDTWFEKWGTGKCIKVLKTRWHILWADGEVRVFDQPHLKFLKES